MTEKEKVKIDNQEFVKRIRRLLERENDRENLGKRGNKREALIHYI